MPFRKLISAVAALAFLATAARAAVRLDYSYGSDGYGFDLPDVEGGYVVSVYGREATPEGQNVYLGFNFYAVHGACPEETNSLCYDNLILLENAEGVAYEPLSTHIMLNTAVYEWARLYVKFKYVGDFAGPCELVVKLGDGDTARLDLGPAEYDFYKMGTVGAREGIDVHVAPDYVSPVLLTLRPGDTIYYTGRESHFWPGPDVLWNESVDFYEVICGDTRGWFASYDDAKRSAYEEQYGEEAEDERRKGIDWGPFAPRYVPRGRAGTAGGGEEGTGR
jgi:hypothetical protein